MKKPLKLFTISFLITIIPFLFFGCQKDIICNKIGFYTYCSAPLIELESITISYNGELYIYTKDDESLLSRALNLFNNTTFYERPISIDGKTETSLLKTVNRKIYKDSSQELIWVTIQTRMKTTMFTLTQDGTLYSLHDYMFNNNLSGHWYESTEKLKFNVIVEFINFTKGAQQ